MSSILNKAKRKKKHEQFGWTNAEVKMLAKDDLLRTSKNKVVLQSYGDFATLGYYILHIHNGFGLKRIIRLEETISKRLELAREDKNLNGKAMAFLLKDKYGIDIQREVNKIPSRELIFLYGNVTNVLRQDDSYKLASASLFNYLSMTCAILKMEFKFSAKEIQAFVDCFADFINTLTRPKQFGLTFPDIARCLCDEINYVDDRYVKVVE